MSNYKVGVRIAAALAAVVMWVISVIFSADGFGFIAPDRRWMGLSLALCVTVLELIFNHEVKRDLTLTLIGGAAYAYGIASNAAGIMAVRGEEPGSVVGILIAVALGFLLDFCPEPVFLWALAGRGGENDFIRKIMGRKFTPEHQEPPRRPQNQPTYRAPQPQAQAQSWSPSHEYRDNQRRQ